MPATIRNVHRHRRKGARDPRLEVIRVDRTYPGKFENILGNLKIKTFLEIALILCEKKGKNSKDLFWKTHYTFGNILF